MFAGQIATGFIRVTPFPKIIKAYGSEIFLPWKQQPSPEPRVSHEVDVRHSRIGGRLLQCVFKRIPNHLVAPRPASPAGPSVLGIAATLCVALLAASTGPDLCPKALRYILEVCPRAKINVVNTALWMNKFPGGAATPLPVINKLIHGLIHSLKRSQPLFIPRIYVCCYFSESAERNHVRGKINHISPL